MLPRTHQGYPRGFSLGHGHGFGSCVLSRSGVRSPLSLIETVLVQWRTGGGRLTGAANGNKYEYGDHNSMATTPSFLSRSRERLKHRHYYRCIARKMSRAHECHDILPIQKSFPFPCSIPAALCPCLTNSFPIACRCPQKLNNALLFFPFG